MKIYITFGQVHRHYIGDNIFDKDVVAGIECGSVMEGRERALKLFGNKFASWYTEVEFNEPGFLSYFPRGLIEVGGAMLMITASPTFKLRWLEADGNDVYGQPVASFANAEGDIFSYYKLQQYWQHTDGTGEWRDIEMGGAE